MSQRPWRTRAPRVPFPRPFRLFAGLAAIILASAIPAGTPLGAGPLGAGPLGIGSPATVQAASCPSSLQSLVNHAASGSTLSVPACTFHESVTINKRLTLLAHGAVIDGDNSRSAGLVVTASHVTVDHLTVQNVKAGDHRGGIYVSGVSYFSLRHSLVRYGGPACLSLNGGTGHRISYNRFASCAQEGFFVNGVSNTVFYGNHIDHNNPHRAYDWTVEAGGGKTMNSTGVTFDHNKVNNNRGPGLWFDNHARNVRVVHNRIYSNDREGVFFEISDGATIAANSIWKNGFGFAAWGYGAGITISSSDRAHVYGNTLAWNARQISVISQNRNSPPHVGTVVHDNIMISASGEKVAGWYDDHGGSLFSSANGNHGYRDRFWVGVREPSGGRFEWSGGRSTLSAYNRTRGEESGKYMTTSQRNTALKAAGIPLP